MTYRKMMCCGIFCAICGSVLEVDYGGSRYPKTRSGIEFGDHLEEDDTEDIENNSHHISTEIVRGDAHSYRWTYSSRVLSEAAIEV